MAPTDTRLRVLLEPERTTKLGGGYRPISVPAVDMGWDTVRGEVHLLGTVAVVRCFLAVREGRRWLRVGLYLSSRWTSSTGLV